MKKLVLILIPGILIIAVCQPKQALQRANKLVIPLTADPVTYDPAHMGNNSSQARSSALIYNGLMRFTIDGRVKPDLADSVIILPEETVYTFYLRKGVKFSTGQELTAADVKFSYERFLRISGRTWVFDRLTGVDDYIAAAGDSAVAGRLMADTSAVSGIRIIDPYTIELTLTQPFAPFLSLLALPQAYITCREEVKRLGQKYGRHPVGSGPFKLIDWQADHYLILEANPDYFGPRPKVKTVKYRIIKDESTALADFEAGNLSLLPITYLEYTRISEDPKWESRLVTQNTLNIYALNLNCSKPPFDNILVRRALNYAIDRKTILERILNGRGTLAKGPVPPGLPGFNLNLTGYEYNPEKARQLLDQAGYPNGFSFEIWLQSDSTFLAVSEAFQAYLKEVGVEVEIIQNEWSVMKTAVRKGAIDSYYRVLSADYPDAENFLYPTFYSGQPTSSNFNYKNPEFDRLIYLAREIQDPVHRIALYQIAEEIVIKDAPWIFFYHDTETWIRQPWVKGLQIPLVHNADKMSGVWIED